MQMVSVERDMLFVERGHKVEPMVVAFLPPVLDVLVVTWAQRFNQQLELQVRSVLIVSAKIDQTYRQLGCFFHSVGAIIKLRFLLVSEVSLHCVGTKAGRRQWLAADRCEGRNGFVKFWVASCDHQSAITSHWVASNWLDWRDMEILLD